MNNQITWKSSNETIAKVDNKGVVTAIELGQADITATVDGKTAKCVVTVVNVGENVTDPVEYKSVWVQENGNRYYYKADGQKMTNSWLNDFYLGSDGKMEVNTCVSSNSKWYYVGGNGKCQYNKWIGDYYVNASGKMLTSQWVEVSGSWSYVNGSGKCQYNQWIGNYYVGTYGKMATNTWIEKYHVNANGKWDRTK